MKIVLTKLELTNFGSWKHAVLPLAQRGLVLIQGRTGSGKSTLFKALYWVLYGENPDGCQADEVVNDLVGKNTAVQLEFMIGAQPYKIIRYRKHAEWKNKLVVWGKTKVLGEKDSKVEILNALIEQLIAMDAGTFLKTVYFIQRDAQRFPALPDGQQKKLIETITDLAILPKAERVTRDKLAAALRMQERLEERCERYDETIHSLEELLQTAHQRLAEHEQDRTAALAQTTHALRETRTKREHMEQEWTRRRAQATIAREHRDEAVNELRRCRDDFHRLTKQQEIIESAAPECPTCGTPLDTARRDALWQRVHQQQTVLDTNMQSLTGEIEAADAQLVALLPKEFDKQLQQLREMEQMLEVQAMQRQEMSASSAIQDLEAELHATRQKRNTSARVKQNVDRFRQRLEFWVRGFGHTGLRTLLLPQVLAQLTARTNYFLSAFEHTELRVQYLLTDGRIAQAYRTHGEARLKSYATLSGGERQMVDIGTSLALRELAETSRASYIDCVLLDEPLEGLDAALAQQLPKLLARIEKGSVFMISHSDQLAPYFSQILTVRKTSHFSSFV